MRKFFYAILILIVLLGTVISAAYYLTGTRQGLELVSQKILADIVPAEDIKIGQVSGRVQDGLTINQLELRNLKHFPPGSLIRIQRVTIRLQSLKVNDLDVDFENIRVFLPNSEPIVLSGRFQKGRLSSNVYSNNISIAEILSFLPRKLDSNPQGRISKIDLYLEGPLSGIQIKGSFNIDQLILPRFTVSDAPGELNLLMKRIPTGYSPSGELSASTGKVRTKFSSMQLQKTHLYFSKSFAEPAFDVRGQASVGKTTMDITLRGSPKAPIWKFSSNPPLPEEILMLMFATGKSFEIVQESWDQQKLTPDVAKDLIDYLLLGGEGGRFAEKFGIKDVSLIYDTDVDVAGIGVTKEITRYLDVGYQIEQEGVSTTAGDIKHTLGAEFKINPKLSVEVDKELYQYRNQERFDIPAKTDDKILLKYKTQF